VAAPGFTAERSLYASRGRYRQSVAAVDRRPVLALAQGDVAPITAGTTAAAPGPQAGDTCHLVSNWIADNECAGDCKVSGGNCVPTEYRLKTLSSMFLHESDSYVLGPSDYEPSACGCVKATPPQIAPAPQTPPEPPGPPGGDWWWVFWSLGGWLVEPDPPWEPPGGHQPPRHELEPGEPFRPWEHFEPRPW
jgi:hypothetical protein